MKEMARQRLPEVFVEQGDRELDSAFPTPFGLPAPWRWSQSLQEPNQAPGGRSMTNHGLACRKTTARMEVGATGCLCKVRMSKSTSLNQEQHGRLGC